MSANDPYIKKNKSVSQMTSESAMRLEARKCQHLCVKCHIEETISRKKGFSENSLSHLTREKLNYVNQLKIKNKGWSSCFIWDENIMRFFDFDHLNPSIKTMNICKMVKDNKYSMVDIMVECSKCRIICKHCHIIHTAHQRMNGIFKHKRKNITKIPPIFILSPHTQTS